MSEATLRAGDLHCSAQRRRAVGGFIVTEGIYPPALKIARHDHEHASLCVVLAGGYDERYGRKSRRVDAGTVIVHPEGEHHDEAHDPVCARLLTIEIERELLDTLRHAVGIFEDPWHRIDYAIAARACRLGAEARRGDEASTLVMEGILFDMLATLGRSNPPDSMRERWLSQVRDCLEAEFHQAPTMRQLARLAGVHPVHLARAFRQRFGCSVGAYVRRLQVGKAAILLADPVHSLSEVAYEAGFADQSHMTRRLRAETGMTPGEWRRR